jgi:hypothetical protein
VLERHGAASRFGVMLLHRHFALTDEEVLLETCDVVSRTLTSRPRTRDRFLGGTVVETSWRLDSPTLLQECQSTCFTPDTGGHQRDHSSSSSKSRAPAETSSTETPRRLR